MGVFVLAEKVKARDLASLAQWSSSDWNESKTHYACVDILCYEGSKNHSNCSFK